MTSKAGSEYRDRAEDLQTEGELKEASQYFTLAAYEYLGDCEYPGGRGLSSAISLGDAIYCLQSAATNYYRAGLQDRAENRCRQGILVCRDFRENRSTYRAIDGVLTECIADFELIAGIGDPTATYEDAVSYYQDVDEAVQWQSEPIFQSTLHFLLSWASDIGESIDQSEQLEVLDSFEKRVELKEETLSMLLGENVD
ncbi:hypothetical protein [Halosimplex sp. TS25]|uniref:hypothetical protein n=1 Tax=Halosimplex rarum TaxID=3396619 RepID=UPI0039EC0CDF